MDCIEQAKRDLRWLVDCPDLLVSSASISLPDPFLTKQQLDWSPILRFHETKASHRVGYYVEALVQVWLEATPGVEHVEHGIQVREDKVTLGELDFLFRKNGQLHHLEVALKFYLYSPEHSVKGSHLIGPNGVDTFERKRDRLLQKQLPSGKVFDPDIHTSQHLVKGMIFYPQGVTEIENPPENLNPAHAIGTWNFLSAHTGGTANVMKKPFWLSRSFDAAEGMELSRDHPSLLAVSEGNREFLVPDVWPGQL